MVHTLSIALTTLRIHGIVKYIVAIGPDQFITPLVAKLKSNLKQILAQLTMDTSWFGNVEMEQMNLHTEILILQSGLI